MAKSETMTTKDGLLPFTIEVVDDDTTLTAHAGLPLVLETMRALGLSEGLDRTLAIRRRRSGATDAQKVEALMLLMAAGGECVGDIEVLRADKGLMRLVGGLPSEDVLLRFLYEFHDEHLIEQAQQRRPAGQVAYIPEESAPLVKLAEGNIAFVHAVAKQTRVTRATLDHDATIQESHKKQSLPHYKGGRGYQPSVLHWAEHDLVLADEYRDGNVPAAMSNLPLIQRGFAALPRTVTERFFRADSACYEEKILKWLADPARVDGPQGRIGFSISADMNERLRKVCEAVPEPVVAALRGARDGDRDVYRGRIRAGRLAEGRRAAAVRRPSDPQEARAALRERVRDEVPRRRQQPSRPHASGAGALALAEGRHDRARARRDQERDRRGRCRPAGASAPMPRGTA